MTFTQWMTLLAVVAGPFGVALGFGLSMCGERVKAQREAKDKQRQQAISRALGLLAAANTVEAEGRSLANAAYLKASLKERGQRPATDQVRAAIESFNSAMGTLDRLILEADVLGPDGLGDVGRMLQARARDLLGVVSDMNQHVTDVNVQKVQKETLPAFIDAIKAATVEVRVLLNA